MIIEIQEKIIIFMLSLVALQACHLLYLVWRNRKAAKREEKHRKEFKEWQDRHNF